MESVEPVRRDVVVEVGQARAFEVFTAEMSAWWPPEHHIGSAPIAEILIEPWEGGRWYTRHLDGSETSTGFVTAWQPPERVVVTWQIGADWQFHPELVTTVEVRFEALTADRTRVVLEHRDLTAYGAHAEAMRDTFDRPEAWTRTLAGYASTVERAS